MMILDFLAKVTTKRRRCRDVLDHEIESSVFAAAVVVVVEQKIVGGANHAD